MPASDKAQPLMSTPYGTTSLAGKKKKTRSMTRTTNPNKGKGSIWAQTKEALSKRKEEADKY